MYQWSGLRLRILHLRSSLSKCFDRRERGMMPHLVLNWNLWMSNKYTLANHTPFSPFAMHLAAGLRKKTIRQEQSSKTRVRNVGRVSIVGAPYPPSTPLRLVLKIVPSSIPSHFVIC